MFRNSNNSKQSSTNIGGWHWLFIALVLALTFVSVGQTPPAQAAPYNPADVYFKLNVYPEKLPTLCPKEKKMLYANVSKTVDTVINDKAFELHGGSFAPAIVGRVTAGTGTLNKELGDIDAPWQVPFLFTADKPGVTTLKFTVPINNSWIGTNENVTGSSVKIEKEVTAKVIPCKFKVGATSQMSACYEGGCIKYLGMTVEGQVKADENGYFTGTAPVVWLSSSAIPNCSAVNTLGIGDVNMRGNLNESGQLLLELNYEPVPFTEKITCPWGKSGSSLAVTVTPLNVSVPSATAVTVNLNQSLSDEAGSIDGSATIVVIPQEDEAVAFNTDSRAALPPSPWKAMLWDGFPWSYSARMALR